MSSSVELFNVKLHKTIEHLDAEQDNRFLYLAGSLQSDFIWDLGKLPFPSHLGKYIIKIGKISTKICVNGKIKAIFGLGMTPL